MAGGCSCNFYITCCLYAATTANIDLGFYGIIAKDRTVAAANIKKTKAAILLSSLSSKLHSTITGSTVDIGCIATAILKADSSVIALDYGELLVSKHRIQALGVDGAAKHCARAQQGRCIARRSLLQRNMSSTQINAGHGINLTVNFNFGIVVHIPLIGHYSFSSLLCSIVAREFIFSTNHRQRARINHATGTHNHALAAQKV